MTKKTRTILFLSFLVFFLLAAPTVVLYSQGYRIDWENKKISQTGGLYLKILPKQAEIYLDGKLEKKTDFFFGSVLIENLLPKKYKIEVKKSGYQSWEKTLEIKEKEVAEAKNIILFAENLDFNTLTKNVEGFWLSPDQKSLILKEKDENGWSLKLYEIEKKVKSHLLYEKDISSKRTDLLKLEFSPDLKEIYLEIGVAEEIKYFKIELNKIPVVLTKREPPSFSIENTLAYQKTNGDIYYLDNNGYVFKTDISFTVKTKINEKLFTIQRETEYKLKIFENNIFLQEGGNLYKFNPELKSFEKFFDKILDLKISPDSKKLVYFSDYEIWILFLKNDGGIPQRKAGEKLFINRLSEKIGDVFWLNSDYLIFNAGDEIKIIEIDNRDKIQTWTIKKTKNPEIFWNSGDKKIYILSEDNLYQSGTVLF